MKFNYFEETYRQPTASERAVEGGASVMSSSAQVSFVGTVRELEEELSKL